MFNKPSPQTVCGTLALCAAALMGFTAFAAQAQPVERSGEQVVKLRCSECHEKGLHGAPKIGDAEAWIPRVKNGLDAVVRSAIHGHGGMPARGGMASLTDAEMRNAVVYMMNKGRVPEKAVK